MTTEDKQKTIKAYLEETKSTIKELKQSLRAPRLHETEVDVVYNQVILRKNLPKT